MSNYSEYVNMSFQQVWPKDADFVADMVNDNGIPVIISLDNLKILYFLLLAKYGSNIIAVSSLDLFKYQVRALIWQYGPTWEKKLDIQTTLRNLTDEELMIGSKSINNRALNPGGTPTTGDLEEIDYINEQTTQQFRKGKLDGYAFLWDLLAQDVTEQFLIKFRKLFEIVALDDCGVCYKYGDEFNDTVEW